MTRLVGTNVPRKDGVAKVTGTALYVDDYQPEDVIFGAAVRSPVARGVLRDVKFGAGIPWQEFTIVRAGDIPGDNVITLMEPDQPCLVTQQINHAEEVVLVLGHPDKHMVYEARRHVELVIDSLPAVLSIDDALARTTLARGDDNLIKEYLIEKGDVDAALRTAPIVVDGCYHTEAQEQLYIETQGMIASYDPEEGLVVRGSMQCPYYIHNALMPIFGLAADKVRVIWAMTGGGFGGKEEYPSMLAAHTALLAYKSGRPAKMIYDRHEDIAVTTKRHPSRTTHRTAVAEDGTLLAIDVDFVIDAGAYCTLSPVVLSRGAIHAAGPYRCENVRIRARAVATNHPPYGAFRGFGAPQSLFAAERQMDAVAKRLKMAPLELRRKNLLRQGDVTATSQTIKDPVPFDQLLEVALRESDYQAKRASFATHNADTTQTTRRGIGLATFYHGAGFTGAGEVYLASKVAVEATDEGLVEVLAANTEIGQGPTTVFSQIAADALGISYEMVDVRAPDTKFVPDSGPTVASRTAMVVGKLVERASQKLKAQLVSAGVLGTAYDDDDFRAACRRFRELHGHCRAEVQYEAPPGIVWDEVAYRGDAYGTFGWAVYVAEVTVDLLTCEVEVDDFVAAQDVGRVLHPIIAAGQIEGGVAQGIGYALCEKLVWKEGRVQNAQMTNYIIPTAMDTPPIRVFFVDNPYPYGPNGAKGMGELPHDGPAPAIMAAIEHATGAVMARIPALPESLMTALTGEG